MSNTDILTTSIPPPTSFLPPLKQLSTTSTTQISFALNTLRSIYFPPAPPPLPKNIAIPKRTVPTLFNFDNNLSSVPDSGYASATDDQEDIGDEEGVEAWERPERDKEGEVEFEILRADGFERAFAIKWVTGFIARCDMWIELVSGGEENDGTLAIEGACTVKNERIRRAKLMEDATRILSLFSTDESEDEDSSSSTITRSFTFTSSSNNQQQIKIELSDEPVSNRDHTSVGLQSWTSSILLAERMVASPFTFLPRPSPFDDSAKPTTTTLRVLELGAGTGLLSIVTAKILQNENESIINKSVSDAIIVATDYHPDVLQNLKKNIQLNFPPSSNCESVSSLPIEVNYLDWVNPLSDYAPLNDRFDVILAADVVYHPDHARWIKTCIEKYLRLPISRKSNTDTDADSGLASGVTNVGGGGIFWLMIAVRTAGRHEGLDITVDECFREKCVDGPQLIILEKEEVVKQGCFGRADEGSYRLFKIGWGSGLKGNL